MGNCWFYRVINTVYWEIESTISTLLSNWLKGLESVTFPNCLKYSWYQNFTHFGCTNVFSTVPLSRKYIPYSLYLMFFWTLDSWHHVFKQVEYESSLNHFSTPLPFVGYVSQLLHSLSFKAILNQRSLRKTNQIWLRDLW